MNAQNAVLTEHETHAVIKNAKNKYEIIPTDSRDYKIKVKEGDWIPVYVGSQSDCQAYETGGQIFKRRHGFSKTMARNMQKKGLNPFLPKSLELYRSIRKLTMKNIKDIKKKKHEKAKLGKKVKASTNKK